MADGKFEKSKIFLDFSETQATGSFGFAGSNFSLKIVK